PVDRGGTQHEQPIGPRIAIFRLIRQTVRVEAILTIDQEALKNPNDRVMRVNNGLRVADHTPDKVAFGGKTDLTGKGREGTHLPHHLPGQGPFTRPHTESAKALLERV